MAQARMFIASDVGGHRELLPGNMHQALFRAGDADDLGKTALHQLSQRPSWPGVLAEARKHVVEERTWQLSVRRYSAVYEQALQISRVS
jgi:glycosyltransferase involved in cell wall biosynthesis